MPNGLQGRSLAVAALVLLAACAGSEPPRPPKPEVGRHGVTLTTEHNGLGVEVGRDQELTIRLETASNTTFEWSLVDFAPGALAAPAAPKFERQALATNFNDASGAEVWRFKPAAPGSTTLKFEYRRVRALDPATRTVSYTVTVR